MRKINKVQLYTLIIILFMFQPVIEKYVGIFKYFDEIVVVISLVSFFVDNKFKLKKYDCQILSLFLLLCILGIAGNILSKSGQNSRAIIQDIVSNGKMVLFALSIRNIQLRDDQKSDLSDNISFLVRALFLIMFITSIVSQFVNIGMTAAPRFGIESYHFIFNNPAGLNTYCYLYFILYSITITKNGKIRKYSLLFTIMGIVPWILTMRSRAIAFAVIYFVLYIYVLYIRKPGTVYRFRWYQIIIVAAVLLLLSWDAIDTYFISNDRSARYNLLHTSFRIAKEYFPIGTGFGTFGTEASRAYYSSVYSKYGLTYIWGLNSSYTKYITDQFWFGIIGQFGYLGTILMAVLIYRTYRALWNIAKREKQSQLACLTLFMTSIFASVTAGTFIQASILPSILIFYLLCNNHTYTENEQ